MANLIPADDTLKEQRRQAIMQHEQWTGLDFVEVNDEAETISLLLNFIPKAAADAQIMPLAIQIENILLTKQGGINAANLIITSIDYPQADGVPHQLLLHLSENSLSAGQDSVQYTLTLVNVQDVDPFFAEVMFSFQTNAPVGSDCLFDTIESLPDEATPQIDYLAKDYQSFRKLILDRLSVLTTSQVENPQGNNVADFSVMLTESLAYAADQLSYYQDAVATEAYLGTARRRVSVKRHARLLDYAMHEGSNARLWLQIQIADDFQAQDLVLPKGSQFLTRIVPGDGNDIDIDSSDYARALNESASFFETLYAIPLSAEHNRILFYTWGADTFSLATGATGATLAGRFDYLNVGDVLVFEQIHSQYNAQSAEADPSIRYAVRLTKVTYGEDPLGGFFLDPAVETALPITEIAWHVQDALPLSLVVAGVYDGIKFKDIAIVSGNIVLADHGRSVSGDLSVGGSQAGDRVPEHGDYRPYLAESAISYSTPFDAASTAAASVSIQQQTTAAQPQVVLTQGQETWYARADLLDSNRFAQHFVVESETQGRAYLRFGNGTYGKRPTPGTEFQVSYRVGNGSEGNIGADALVHRVIGPADTVIPIKAIRNPLPAQGGTDAEPIEQVRLYAPQAFRGQLRAVTEADYVTLAMQHPEVTRAAARIQWTGSWNTVFISVLRGSDLVIDESFQAELLDFLRAFQLLGQDVQIVSPYYVTLDISLVIYVKSGYLPNVVRQSLLEHFSDGDADDGQQGFFHPSHFGFGDDVYLSTIVTQAMSIAGVEWIDLASAKTLFQRWNQSAGENQLEEGRINVEPLEIVQLKNDPAVPEQGRMDFIMEEPL
ncbi:MAG: putative baseplate assembly protein [Pseudomonadales bacterium]